MYQIVYALQKLKDALEKPHFDGKITINVNDQECEIKDVIRRSANGMITLSVLDSVAHQTITVPSDTMVKVYPLVYNYSTTTSVGSTETITSDSWVVVPDKNPAPVPEPVKPAEPPPFILVALNLDKASPLELKYANDKIVTAYSEGRVVEFEQLNGAYYVIRFGEAHNRLTSKVW